MKQALLQETVTIPQEITLELDGSLFKIVGPKGVIQRRLEYPFISIQKIEGKVIISAKNATKKHKTIINTFKSHVKNMIKGVQEGYEYKIKICYTHFPITITIKDNEATIKNFLGAKVPLVAKILPGVKVTLNGDVITLVGHDKEAVGQTSANFEKATVIRNRDRRKFQDGCYIFVKAGKKL